MHHAMLVGFRVIHWGVALICRSFTFAMRNLVVWPRNVRCSKRRAKITMLNNCVFMPILDEQENTIKSSRILFTHESSIFIYEEVNVTTHPHNTIKTVKEFMIITLNLEWYRTESAKILLLPYCDVRRPTIRSEKKGVRRSNLLIFIRSTHKKLKPSVCNKLDTRHFHLSKTIFSSPIFIYPWNLNTNSNNLLVFFSFLFLHGWWKRKSQKQCQLLCAHWVREANGNTQRMAIVISLLISLVEIAGESPIKIINKFIPLAT